ncbi:MAG: hypothetical protein O3C60_18455 [Planctomycetota bacterium]|nr:hypothetical protein [Planctomycetota bacterium]
MVQQTVLRKTSGVRGLIIYRGPSMLGNGNVVCVATLRTSNRKTGDMVQTWILPDDGLSPLRAVQAELNAQACGSCPLQGYWNGRKLVDRVCYVNLGQAPDAVWRGLQRGIYPVYNRQTHEHLLLGRKIRLGAYGDPAALPYNLLRYLCDISSGWTGYTHQAFWIDPQRAEFLASILMVSCHNSAQRIEALRRGWRPFTTIRADEERPTESVECPAYTHGVSCARCGLCKGLASNARPVYVIAHGKPGLNLGSVQRKGE